MAIRNGNPGIYDNVAAVRAVKSGHLHECPDGRVGIYTGAQDVAIGGVISLDTNATVIVDCSALALAAAGALVNFNFTTQLVVASGGTNIGRYKSAKALNATKATVTLNNTGMPVA